MQPQSPYERQIRAWLAQLGSEAALSPHTLAAYRRDLSAFAGFVAVPISFAVGALDSPPDEVVLRIGSD